MGAILIGKCECGFKSRQLFVGDGIIRSSSFVPAYCSDCQSIFTVKPSVLEPKCKRCGQDAIFYKYDELKSPPDAQYPCPKCNQDKMTFEDVGMWD